MEGLLCSASVEWFRRTELRKGYQLASPFLLGPGYFPGMEDSCYFAQLPETLFSQGNSFLLEPTNQGVGDVLPKG